jgi:citrate lyase subunit beta/citryl-CoA lyase
MTVLQDQSPCSWRSLLYVPANNPRFVGKAQQRGADGVVLDLEDSVPDTDKENARNLCAEAIAEMVDGPSDVLVRINASLRQAIPDLEKIVQPGLKAILLPKADRPDKIALLAETLDELEAERGIALGSIKFIPMIEAPAGFFAASDIATVSSRSVGLLLGSEDFATEAGMEPDPETLLLPRQQLVFAARKAGLVPYGLLESAADYSNVEKTLEIARRAARFGFEGSTCVHPALVPVLNQAFSPSVEQISHAREVMATLETAAAQGKGAAVLKGRMIDAPMRKRAERLLVRAQRFGLI